MNKLIQMISRISYWNKHWNSKYTFLNPLRITVQRQLQRRQLQRNLHNNRKQFLCAFVPSECVIKTSTRQQFCWGPHRVRVKAQVRVWEPENDVLVWQNATCTQKFRWMAVKWVRYVHGIRSGNLHPVIAILLLIMPCAHIFLKNVWSGQP